MNDGFEPRFEDYRLLTGAGQFLDDERAASAALWRVRALAACICHDPRDRHGDGFGAARGHRRVDRRRTGARRGGGHQRGHPGAGRRRTWWCRRIRPCAATRAPCRRSGGAGRRRERGGGARRGRAGRGRLRRARAGHRPSPARSCPMRRACGRRRRATSRSTGTASRRTRRLGRRSTQAFAGAAHVARVRLVNQRIVMAPMEPRARARRVRSRDRPLHAALRARRARSCCGTTSPRASASRRDRVRVVTGDVGGAFGMRTTAYPEYAALLLAAKQTGRPSALAVDALRGVPDRQPGPRHGHRGGPGARCRRQVPRASTSTNWPVWAPT